MNSYVLDNLKEYSFLLGNLKGCFDIWGSSDECVYCSQRFRGIYKIYDIYCVCDICFSKHYSCVCDRCLRVFL